MKKNRNRLISIIVVLVFCLNVNVYAADVNTELDSVEKMDDIDENMFEQLDQYVDGLYNISEAARSDVTGIIRLGQSGTKVCASYSTSYTHTVDRIGVKNVALQYKSSLKIWYDIITFDNEYRTNKSMYAGSFTCNGTFARVYRLKATHYITDNGSTQSEFNVTGEMTFK